MNTNGHESRTYSCGFVSIRGSMVFVWSVVYPTIVALTTSDSGPFSPLR